MFHWAALFIIFNALMNGLYQIFTRQIADTEAAETSALYSSIVGAFGMLVVLPFVWRTPSSLTHVALFYSLGLLGAISHYFVALALGFAPANIMTPFLYVQMLGSWPAGYLLFGALTWLGAAIVVFTPAGHRPGTHKGTSTDAQGFTARVRLPGVNPASAISASTGLIRIETRSSAAPIS